MKKEEIEAIILEKIDIKVMAEPGWSAWLVGVKEAAAAIALRLATLADEALEKERKPSKNNTPQEHIDLKYINTSAGKI